MFYPISKMFATHFTTNLLLNICRFIIYKLTIIQENAFSEASFRTLDWNASICYDVEQIQNFDIHQESLLWKTIPN